MEKVIVTTGKHYADIDGFACALAYAETLRLKGLESEAVITSPLNFSVPKYLLDPIPVYRIETASSDYSSNNKYLKYIMVDTNDLSTFPDFVNTEKVIELFDHHTGNEAFWNNKLNDLCHIEMVGACATLIWEKSKRLGVSNKLSFSNLRLLLAAVVSNTLNFKSTVTTERDIKAYEELKTSLNLDNNWCDNYFSQVQNDVEKNLELALSLDTKKYKTRENQQIVIAQLELWNSEEVITKNQFKIIEAMDKLGVKWFLMSPSIKDGFNIIMTKDEELKHILEQLLDVSFNGYLAKTNKLWLRKEIIKKLSDTNTVLF